MAISRRSRNHNIDAWPGFVDALASVLLVFVFMLMIFVLGQYFLTEVLLGRDRALEVLKQEVAQLAETLAMSERHADQQQEELFALRGRLDATLKTNRELSLELEQVRAQLADANSKVNIGERQLEIKLRELASLQQDIDALQQLRAQLEQRILLLAQADTEKERNLQQLTGELEQTRQQDEEKARQLTALADQINALERARDHANQQLDERNAQAETLALQLGALRDRSKALETELADSQERTLLAQHELEQRDIRIHDLTRQIEDSAEALRAEQSLSQQKRDEVAALREQMLALREQLSALSQTLELSQKEVKIQKVELDDLTRRLNLELARKVEELSRYRSEFFGKLREALGNHPDIRVVGDRFTFQSELLFESGSDEIGDAGKQQLTKLAGTLLDIAGRIPPEIEWILRVDGHTDKRPIQTERFPTNWELSTARAVSIVKFLIDAGIPPTRLAATGFGEFHPLDPADTPEAYSRNRRIEIKLTGR